MAQESALGPEGSQKESLTPKVLLLFQPLAPGGHATAAGPGGGGEETGRGVPSTLSRGPWKMDW